MIKCQVNCIQGVDDALIKIPVIVKHDYRDIKKQLAEDFYRSQGIGLMLGD